VPTAVRDRLLNEALHLAGERRGVMRALRWPLQAATAWEDTVLSLIRTSEGA
jgi:hypothetical protein